jgi:hypothetical protein
MTEPTMQGQPRTRPLPGTGRLGIVAAYFGLYGLAAAGITLDMARVILIPPVSWPTTPVKALLTFAAAVALTFGFFRTYHLLRRRRRTGASLAALCLAGSLATSLSPGSFNAWALGVPVLGLVLLGTVWRHLE